MLGTVLNYAVRHPGRLVRALANDPAQVWEKLHDRLVQQKEYETPVHVCEETPDWEQQLHAWLGVPASCDERREFWPLWQQVVQDVRAKGVDVGPASFAGYNDGDAALVRAVWCIVRHLKPLRVIETGVGHGFTSRLILEAIARNGAGHLSSIDRPPLDDALGAKVGIAVTQSLRDRWTLVAGSSRRCLPGLLKRSGSIDLFIHDSLHTEENVLFEMEHAWAALRPGGLAVIDDIDSNAGFGSFVRQRPGCDALVCAAEPVRPDYRRFNARGLFAILRKR